MGKFTLSPRGRMDLLRVGPRIPIAVARPSMLPNGNFGIPAEGFIDTEAIIDTGATRTVVEPDFALRIGLRLVDPAAKVARVGGIDTVAVYVAAIRFPPELPTVRLVRVFAAPLLEQPVRCLIGRDILQRWRMVYDGRTGEVTLEEDEGGPPPIDVD